MWFLKLQMDYNVNQKLYIFIRLEYNQNKRGVVVKKRILIPIALLASEFLLTSVVYYNDQNAYIPLFSLSNAAFVWGVLFIFLALAVMFGVENKYNLALSANSTSSNYIANVANFIGNISKNFYSRFYDFSTGTSILILSILNFIAYFILIY